MIKWYWLWRFLITWSGRNFLDMLETIEIGYYPDLENCTWWFPHREIESECDGVCTS